MQQIPVAAAKIANDYLERLKSALGSVTVRERDEFLREIHPHIYEAYQQAPGDDEVLKILAVLRQLGEPSEVVSERLPQSMVKAGSRRSLPLMILGGIVVALFGVPMGAAGVAVLVGVMMGLVGVVAGYFAATGAMFLAGAASVGLGLIAIYQPRLWERMIELGVVHMDGEAAAVLDQLLPGGQGFLLILMGAVFAGLGLVMLWLGRYLLRGMRFLVILAFDSLRRMARTLRRKLHSSAARDGAPMGHPSFAGETQN